MADPNPMDLIRAALDPVRIAVLGSAASGPVRISDLADRLAVDRKQVAKAVGELSAAGLLDAEGRLSTDMLRQIGQSLPKANEGLGAPVDGPWTEDEARTLGRFFDGSRLVQLPQSTRKRRLVLEKIAQEFEPGRRYPERDVNFMIQLVYPDYASVRRYMIEEGFMDRADGAYWRTGGRYDLEDSSPSVEESGIRRVDVPMDGLELRGWDATLIPDLIASANDERIPRFMGDMFPHPYTDEAAHSWIDVAESSPTQFAVLVDGIAAGGMGGFPLKAEATGSMEIGWWIKPDLWGRGITTACVKAMIEVFFAELGFMRLWAPVMHPNRASARVAEKAGLTLEGVARSHYLKGGVRYDQLNFAITRADWQARR